jgi:hypothetical protein
MSYDQPQPGQPAYPYPQPGYAPGYGPVGYISPHSRTVAAVLCFFFGVLGVHRFYVGKVGTGILQILTAGGFGLWALIDFIVILVGGFRDKNGLPLIRW